MSDRPAPKVSPLAKLSPITATTVEPELQPPSKAPSVSTGDVTKYTLRLPTGLLDRARSALVYTMPHEGIRSLTTILTTGIETEVHRLETQYNNGERFPAVGPLTRGPLT